MFIITEITTDRKVIENETDNHLFCVGNFHIDFVQQQNRKTSNSMTTTTNESLTFKSGYSEVNGLKMYYEIHGQGKPLVLVHGGGSTIQTNFEKLFRYLLKIDK